MSEYGTKPDTDIKPDSAANAAVQRIRNAVAHQANAYPPLADDPALWAMLRAADHERTAALSADLKMPDVPLVPPPASDAEADAAILRRNIARRMKAAGLSPRELSLAAALNEAALQQILTGRILSPRRATLVAISSALACTLDDLTGDAWFRPWPEDSAAARRAIAHQFLTGAEWRRRAERVKAGSPSQARQLFETANGLDFIDGPYEWRQTHASAAAASVGAAGTMMLTGDIFTPARRDLSGATFAAHGRGGAGFSAEPRATMVPLTAGAKDLPVYAAAQGGPEGSFILDYTPIDYVARPE
ncbi:MAG: helix-turn-helix domain-containing protein, partial [Rhodospirillaceae bacterium]|nr:helix-turn-helix domain-containing protein [Rhodospirillaceae bacterium]